jgi:hypothetical protein
MVDYGNIFHVEGSVLASLGSIRKFFGHKCWRVAGIYEHVDYSSALSFARTSKISDEKLMALVIWLVAPDLKGLLESVNVPTRDLGIHLESRTSLSKSLSGELGSRLPEELLIHGLIGWATELLIDLLPQVSDQKLLETYRVLMGGIWDLMFGLESGGAPNSPESIHILKSVPIFATPPEMEKIYLGWVGLTSSLLMPVFRTAGDGGLPEYVLDLLARAITEAKKIDNSAPKRKALREIVVSILDCVESGEVSRQGVAHLLKLILGRGSRDYVYWLLVRRDENLAISLINVMAEDNYFSANYIARFCKELLQELDRWWAGASEDSRLDKVYLVTSLLERTSADDLHQVFSTRLAEIRKIQVAKKKGAERTEVYLRGLLA